MWRSGADLQAFDRVRLRLPVMALLLCLIISSIALIFSAMAFKERLDAVEAADSDNQGWSISQLDVDHRSLRLALKNAVSPFSELGAEVSSDEMDDIRLAFDIYYSRVSIVVEAYGDLDLPPDISGKIDQMVADRDRMADRIDAMERPEQGDMRALAAALDETALPVREITTGVLQYFVTASHQAREEQAQLVSRFQVEALVLLVLMVLSSFLAIRLWSDLEQRSAMTERAAENVTKAYEASLSAVLVADLSGRVLECNGTAQRVLGYSEDEMCSGRLDEMFVPDRYLEKYRELMEEFHRSGYHPMLDTGRVRTIAKRASGEEFPADLSITSERNMLGERIFIIYLTDVSEQVAAEEKLKAARDEAERSAQAKSMFLATMSHEMRTPLHGLISSLELLDEDDLSPENRSLIKTARDCSDRALAQVNEVLDLTRLGESREVASVFSPHQVVLDIVEELRPLAIERGNVIHVDVSGQSRAVYLGAASAFARVIYNLAGNAVKFTEGGKIDIAMAFTVKGDGGARLAVSVSDTGVGIAPEDQERIFNEFETLGPSEFSAAKGSGLGLAIAQMAVRRLGGRLEVESSPGEGSRFSFEIELDEAQGALPEPAPAEEMAMPQEARSARVLLVDDNKVNRLLMEQMVTRLGHEVDSACDGLEAVTKAANTAYEIILMDVSMPVMDGCEATTRIRADGASQNAAILGVTALVDLEDPELRGSGMNEILAKPLKLDTLREAISRHLAQRDEGAGSTGPASSMVDDLGAFVGRETAEALIRQSLADAQGALDAMRRPDLAHAERASTIHSAVGSAGVVGLEVLSKTLSDAEQAALAGDNAAVEALIDDVAAALLAVEARLDPEPSARIA